MQTSKSAYNSTEITLYKKIPDQVQNDVRGVILKYYFMIPAKLSLPAVPRSAVSYRLWSVRLYIG